MKHIFTEKDDFNDTIPFNLKSAPAILFKCVHKTVCMSGNDISKFKDNLRAFINKLRNESIGHRCLHLTTFVTKFLDGRADGQGQL